MTQVKEPKINRQGQRVLDYILDHGSITSLDAQKDIAVISLPKRISELRKLGFDILDKTETVPNRYGEKVTFKRYFFDEEDIVNV